MYIISYEHDLEKLKNYENQIEPPEAMKAFFRYGDESLLSLLSY
jgi:hypothetical protein